MTSISSNQIEAIIVEVLPDECELAGASHVSTVSGFAARGELSPAQPPSRVGYRTSPEAAMLAVAAAANFIKVCIEIYLRVPKS
jgi:hypothetical protein